MGRIRDTAGGTPPGSPDGTPALTPIKVTERAGSCGSDVFQLVRKSFDILFFQLDPTERSDQFRDGGTGRCWRRAGGPGGPVKGIEPKTSSFCKRRCLGRGRWKFLKLSAILDGGTLGPGDGTRSGEPASLRSKFRLDYFSCYFYETYAHIEVERCFL